LWREWIKPFAVVAAVVFPLKSAIADWNWVPTGSMKPTILEGDLVLVNKLAYDLKVPFTLQRLAEWSNPERGDIAPTCVAHYAKDLSTRLVADKRFPHGVRPYTVREYARLQGVPDTFTFTGSDNDAYRMIGNGVSVPVGEWIGSEIVRYFQ